MARKKVESKEELTTDQVFDVLRFASQIYGMQNVYTPDLVNSRMKDVTMSPQMATVDKINNALLNPKNNEQLLIGMSQFLELNSMLYKRILLYFSGLMSFDFNYICENIKDSSEYDSPAYKKDLLTVQSFFDKFNMKYEFKTIMKQLMRQETFYGILRDDGDKLTIQELPQNYCQLTGRFSQGLLFDFNMYFFLLPGVDIELFPSAFKKMYRKAFVKPGTLDYNPAAQLSMRDGSWVYWVQTSPEENFVAFKFFPEIITNVPFLSPLMADVVLQPVIRSLQTNSFIQQASKMLFGEIPMLKDAKASVTNQISMTPDVAGKFLGLLKSGLSDTIKVAAAPLTNFQGIEFTGSDDMYTKFLQSTASSSGINSRLIYSNDRQNIIETKLSLDIDQNILRNVYFQFSNMLNYWINQRTKKYKFKILFEGFETTTDRAERLETVNKLADSGIVLEQKFASAIGMSPFDFRRMLEESKKNKFVENLTPIIKSNQMSGGVGGRPSKSESELGDAGANTRDIGSNIDKESE